MIPYDTANFDPPAPTARVEIRALDGSLESTVALMLIDTGADITLLPRIAAQALNLTEEPGSAYELIAFDGTRTLGHTVQAEVRFLGRSFKGLFALTEEDYGILGRNVLNRVRIVFDGPGLSWQELSRLDAL